MGALPERRRKVPQVPCYQRIRFSADSDFQKWNIIRIGKCMVERASGDPDASFFRKEKKLLHFRPRKIKFDTVKHHTVLLQNSRVYQQAKLLFRHTIEELSGNAAGIQKSRHDDIRV